MQFSNEIRTFAGIHNIDIAREWKEAKKEFLGKDKAQFARILQNAHQSVYCIHTRTDFTLPRGDIICGFRTDREQAFIDAVWTLAAVEEANGRLGTSGQEPVPFKGLEDLSVNDLIPGDKKVPTAVETPLLGAMKKLHVPLASNRLDYPGFDLQDSRVSKAIEKLGLTPEAAKKFARPIKDQTQLYEGQSPTPVNHYKGGMSEREVQASKAAMAKQRIR
jgi:hypothetical protein